MMTKKFYFAVVLLLSIMAIIIWGTLFLKNTTEELKAPLEEMKDSLMAEDYQNAKDYFDEFTVKYSGKKKFLSFFLHDSDLDEINTSIKKLSTLFESDFIEEVLPESEKLLESVLLIYEKNAFSLEKIF